MSRMEVKVLSSKFSTFVVRVRIVLKIKGVEYQSLEENLPFQKSDLLLKSNPVYKKVPVLIHGDRAIPESLVILQYIDEAWSSGPAILPSDPYERAMTRFWAAFIDDQLVQHVRSMFYSGEDEAGTASTVEQLLRGLILLDEALTKLRSGGAGGDGRFFGGDRIGYLDLVLGSLVPWISAGQRMLNLDFFNDDKTPRLVKWAREFLDNEHVKDTMPDADQIFEFVSRARNAAPPAASEN